MESPQESDIWVCLKMEWAISTGKMMHQVIQETHGGQDMVRHAMLDI